MAGLFLLFGMLAVGMALDATSGDDDPGGAHAATESASDEDILEGDTGDDDMHGGRGDDRLDGGNHNDMRHGGDGNDVMESGSSDNALHGEVGDDVISGSMVEDLIADVDGNDNIFGTQGAVEMAPRVNQDSEDTIGGGKGDDILVPSQRDHGHGGEGADAFDLGTRIDEDHSVVHDYDPAEDRIELSFDPSNIDDVTAELKVVFEGPNTRILVGGETVGLVVGQHVPLGDILVVPALLS